MVENVLYFGWKPILLSFILKTYVAFKKTRPRHHSCMSSAKKYRLVCLHFIHRIFERGRVSSGESRAKVPLHFSLSLVSLLTSACSGWSIIYLIVGVTQDQLDILEEVLSIGFLSGLI